MLDVLMDILFYNELYYFYLDVVLHMFLLWIIL